MPKKISKTDVEIWLKSHAPHIELHIWAGKANIKSTFKNKKYNTYFDIEFKQLKYYILKNPNREFGIPRHLHGKKIADSKEGKTGYRGSKILKKEDVEKWLEVNCDYIILINWSGYSNKKSKFKDVNRDVVFNISFGNLKDCLKRNPNTIFGASKEEKVNQAKKTFYKNWKVSNPNKTDEVKNKILSTKIKKGYCGKFEKKIFKNWAEEKGISRTQAEKVIKNNGVNYYLNNYHKQQTILENIIFNMLVSNKINNFIYDRKFKDTSYKPDFIIDDFNLIIECDGLYWHSEAIKPKQYHKDKKESYTSHNYTSLFFRENEILHKPDIVQSIILNKLSKSNRVYARNTSFQRLQDKNVGKLFLEQNHLMGNGAGRYYILTDKNDNICSSMQVKWRNVQDGILEISRFCNKLNHSVIGAFTKLLRNIINEERPNSIVTFIDRRYGDGCYLRSFGFKKVNESLSFKWTDGINVYNRMNFPGKIGYDYGLFKIWDCGQAKYLLDV